MFDNEWMLIPGAAVAEVTGSLPPMPGPDEPGPFSLADPGRVRAVLAAAGYHSVAITPPRRSRGDQRGPDLGIDPYPRPMITPDFPVIGQVTRLSGSSRAGIPGGYGGDPQDFAELE